MDADWDEVEAFVTKAFAGQYRKDNVSPACDHSLRVGRRLRRDGEGPGTILAGYLHDVFEDVQALRAQDLRAQHDIASLLAVRFLGLPAPEAAVVADTILECCYTPAEYAEEERLGGKDGKAFRKAAATARWLAGSIDVCLVKRADIDDNSADMAAMSSEFRAAYGAWSRPLRDGLEKRILALKASFTEPERAVPAL